MAKSRARENITALIGRYEGVVVSDGYNAYDDFKHRHRCWAHLTREFEEYAAQSDEIKRQYDRFVALYAKGQRLKEQQQADKLPINEQVIEEIKFEFWDIVTCLQPIKATHGIHTLMKNGGEQWFTAYYHLGVPLDNNLAERGLRPIVLLRKVIGCYRNDKGKQWIENVVSVVQTWQLQGKNIYQELRAVAR